MGRGHVLLVTYYWPPSGGVAVLRWLHFTYQLAEMGYKITVYHPQNAVYPTVDQSMLQHIHPTIETISHPIIEPATLYEKFTGTKPDGGNGVFMDDSSLLKKWALYLRANIFIPDARMLWINPSVRFLNKWIRQHHPDLIITNGTPHSCHIIGLKLKQKHTQVPWLADFRDPWLEIDYFSQLPLTKKTKVKHENLEQRVLSMADCISTVSPSWKQLFLKKGAKDVVLLTNGFQAEDFRNKIEKTSNNTLVISHLGTLNHDRNPVNFWKAIANHPQVLVKLIGSVNLPNLEEIGTLANIQIKPAVSHDKAIQIMQSSDALLLLNNQVGETKGRIPAKVFEYLASETPIIYMGKKDNDTYRLLQDMVAKESANVYFLTYEEELNIDVLCIWIKETKQIKTKSYEQYSRQAISRKLSSLIDQLI